MTTLSFIGYILRKVCRHCIILFLDSCQPEKWEVKSVTQTIRQRKIQHQSDEGEGLNPEETPNGFIVLVELDLRLYDGLSGGLNPSIVWLT